MRRNTLHTAIKDRPYRQKAANLPELPSLTDINKQVCQQQTRYHALQTKTHGPRPKRLTADDLLKNSDTDVDAGFCPRPAGRVARLASRTPVRSPARTHKDRLNPATAIPRPPTKKPCALYRVFESSEPRDPMKQPGH